MDAQHANNAPLGSTSASPQALQPLATSEGTPFAPLPPEARMIHVRLGDLELRVDVLALARLALDPLEGLLRSQNMALMIPLRGMAVAAYPMLRRMMRQFMPHMPQPDLPRGADPVRYLASYVVAVASQGLLERQWVLDYTDHADGSVEVTAIRSESLGASTDAAHASAGAGMDTPDPQAATRTA